MNIDATMGSVFHSCSRKKMKAMWIASIGRMNYGKLSTLTPVFKVHRFGVKNIVAD